MKTISLNDAIDMVLGSKAVLVNIFVVGRPLYEQPPPVVIEKEQAIVYLRNASGRAIISQLPQCSYVWLGAVSKRYSFSVKG